MTSRLSAFAALFAIVTTTTLAVAASTPAREPVRRVASAAPMPVVVLPMVQVTGRRVR